MKFKIGTRLSPELRKQPIENIAGWAAGAGLDFLDVFQMTSEVKQACDAAGIGIGSVDAQGIPQLLSKDEGRSEDAAMALKRQITEVAALGGKILFMVLLPEDVNLPRSETFAIWKEVFPAIVRHAEQEGVYLAVEGWPGRAPHYPAIGCTPETLRAMFKEIPSKHFGLNYDPSHLVRLGIDHLRLLGEFGDRILHVHGKDTEILHDDLYECGILPATFGPKYKYSEGSWRYTISGHGEVKWNQIALRLEQLGYQGGISIELEDHRFWGSLELEQEGIVKGAEHLALFFR